MRTIATTNDFELRLSSEPREIEAAQRLRYRVFYDEMGAKADSDTAAAQLDCDRFDSINDHLIVLDRHLSLPDAPVVAGCYRALHADKAAAHGGLYTSQEFDLGPLQRRGSSMLELGRSCIDPAYRSGIVLQLLWRGIAELIDLYNVDLLIGCASIPGTDVDAVAPTLAYLHSEHLAPAELRPRALPHRYVPLVQGVFEPEAIAAGKRTLPALLKGYLRAGAMIGDGAVIDAQFNTVDVCMVLPTDELRQRYAQHYQRARAARRADRADA